MGDVQCLLKIVVKRYDGQAILGRWVTMPRVPVAGDFVVLRYDHDHDERVTKVVLHPVEKEYAPAVWVYFHADEDFNRHYENDDFCGGRPQNIREGIEGYLDEEWEISSLQTVWRNGWCTAQLAAIYEMAGL